MLLPILPQPASLWLSENLSETFYWPASLIYELPCHHQSSIFSWYALPTFTKKGNQKVRSGREIYVKTNFLGRFFCTTFKGGHFYWTFFPTTNILLLLWFFTPDFGFWDWGILERLSDCSSYFLLVTEWINITIRSDTNWHWLLFFLVVDDAQIVINMSLSASPPLQNTFQ